MKLPPYFRMESKICLAAKGNGVSWGTRRCLQRYKEYKQRIIEWFGLEGTVKGHPVQLPAQCSSNVQKGALTWMRIRSAVILGSKLLMGLGSCFVCFLFAFRCIAPISFFDIWPGSVGKIAQGWAAQPGLPSLLAHPTHNGSSSRPTQLFISVSLEPWVQIPRAGVNNSAACTMSKATTRIKWFVNNYWACFCWGPLDRTKKWTNCIHMHKCCKLQTELFILIHRR